MSTVDKIKKAASALSVNEREELLSWLLDVDDDWDRQMAKDAASGKLDFLIEEARTAVREESLHDWPSQKLDLEDDWLRVANLPPNPGRISAAVQNRADTDHLPLNAIIDRKREAFTQTSVISKEFGVKTAVDSQRVDIIQDGLAKIAAQTAGLLLIKSKPVD